MKQSVPYIIIAALVIYIVMSLIHKSEQQAGNAEYVEIVRVDTVTILKTDTFRLVEPIFKSEVIVDTIYMEKSHENGLKLSITQRYYEGSQYQAWVSGYKPSLDSLNVFNKTLTQTITETVTKEVYPKTLDVYLNGGCFSIDNKISPFIGVSVKLKKGIMLTGNVGYYNRSPFYGLSVGIKVNK